jgi:glycosyltransferase involved in cell wall biosynthesis
MKISIITPSLNQANFIEATIHSVLSQELTSSFEFLIIDGGSSDGTIEILKKHEDRLHWISGTDSGQADAINKGIAMATGEIIGWLNSDDVYLPGTLQKVLNAFEQYPDRQWLFGKCKMIDESGKEVRKWITWYKNLLSRTFSFNRLLTENYISQPAVFFRRKAFFDAGSLNQALHYAMDFDLWLRFAKMSPPIIIPENLASFRLHNSSKSIRNHRNLFSEQYAVHLKYHHGKWLLLIHRINIAKILLVYGIMEKLRKIKNGGNKVS